MTERRITKNPNRLPPHWPLRFAKIGVERKLSTVVLNRAMVRQSDKGIARLMGPALAFFDDSPALVRAVAQIQAERGDLGLAITNNLLDEARRRVEAGEINYSDTWKTEDHND